jgi:hypothetical protein
VLDSSCSSKMLSQSTNVRTWVFMGMAMFYVLFLLTVVKYFEDSEPLVTSRTTKPVQSIVVTDRIGLPGFAPVAERQWSSHVVRVPHSPDSPQDLNYRALLRREFDKDDSKINAVIDGVRASGICEDSSWDNVATRDHCRRLFPTNIRPRLREPMLKRNSLVIRSLLGWAWKAIGSNKSTVQRGYSRKWEISQAQLLSNGRSGRYIVNSEWGKSRTR